VISSPILSGWAKSRPLKDGRSAFVVIFEGEMKKVNIAVIILFAVIASSLPAFSQYEVPGMNAELLGLMDSARKEENILLAIEKYLKVVEKFPGTDEAGEAYMAIAETRFLMGEYETAHFNYEVFTKLFIRHKQTPLAWYRMGLCSMENGKYDLAVEEFRRAISSNPWSGFVVPSKTGIANAYYKKEDYIRALREYRWIFPTREIEPYVLYQTYLCYMKTDNDRVAQITADDLCRRYPLSSEAKFIRHPEETVEIKEGVPPSTAEISEETIEILAVPVEKIAVAETHALWPLDRQVWTVQVGSFISEENAQAQVRELKKKGLDPWTQKATVGLDNFYRVNIGKFTDEKKAKELAAKIKAEGAMPAHVVKIK